MQMVIMMVIGTAHDPRLECPTEQQYLITQRLILFIISRFLCRDNQKIRLGRTDKYK